jgi:malonyl CoA-acyl carrier protein transacylase
MDRPRRAGVSSFGISGTNAHVIVEAAPAVPAPEEADPLGEPAWPLSARSERDLRRMATELRSVTVGPAEVAGALARVRTSAAHRAVVLAPHRDGLEAIASGADADTVVRGDEGEPGPTVLVFPGQGTQWPGMGAGLLASSTVFAAAVEDCRDALAPYVDWSLPDVLRAAPGQPPLDRIDVLQPALFSVMVALAALWASYGVVPDAVVGHSQGEVAAAHVAGALSLQDAARVVAVRSRLLRTLGDSGAMLSVAQSPAEVADRLAGRPGLSVAVENGPRSVVVAGDAVAVAMLEAELGAAGVRTRRVPSGVAGHTAQVDLIGPELVAELAPVVPRAAGIPMYSTVDADWVDPAALTAGYWLRNVRSPVRFARSVQSLIGLGHRRFVEVSPHPALTGAIEEVADQVGADVLAVGTLRRGDGTPARFVRSVAEAYVRGVPVRWPAYGDAELPTYPFQRRRFWWTASPRAAATHAAATGAEATGAEATGAEVGGPVPSGAVARTPIAAGTALADQLRDLPESSALALVTDVVVEAVRAVSGYVEVPTDRPFLDLGISSMTAIDLRNRLVRTTGLRLPATVALDHPTAAALAGRLVAAMRAGTSSDLPAGIGPLYRHALSSADPGAAMDLLGAVARMRPSIKVTAVDVTDGESIDMSAGGIAAAVPLSTGPRPPLLLWFPSVLPLSGPAEYARLGRALNGVRAAAVLPQPGFVAGQPLPADLDTLLNVQAAAVVRAAAGDAVVLCGHSSGGWLAHEVAARLAAGAYAVAGVVLVDSFWPDEKLLADRLPAALRLLAERTGGIADADADADDPVRLTASGRYMRLLAAHRPVPSAARTLHLAAGEALGGPARWQGEHTALALPGDHFSVMTDHADAVVRAIEEWLA